MITLKTIKKEISPLYSPQSNIMVERLQQTMMSMTRWHLEMIKNILHHTNIWDESFHTANFLRNRQHSTSGTRNLEPIQSLLGLQAYFVNPTSVCPKTFLL